MGEALALLALALFSANVLVVRLASVRLGQGVGFLLGLGSNVVFAAVLFGVEQLARPEPFTIEWGAFAAFAVGGLFTAYLGRRLFFRSVHTIGPSRASALQITNPVFAALIGWLLLGETLGSAAIGFGLLVVVGLYLTSRGTPRAGGGGDVATPDPTEGRGGLPYREMALALIGALSYAVGNVIRSSAVRDWDQAVFGGLLGACSATLVYLVAHTDVRQLAADIRAAPLSGRWLWILSGVLTISAQVSLIASTRTIPVAVSVLVAAAIPLVVTPISIVFFRNTERLDRRNVSGILLIFVGVTGLLLAP